MRRNLGQFLSATSSKSQAFQGHRGRSEKLATMAMERRRPRPERRESRNLTQRHKDAETQKGSEEEGEEVKSSFSFFVFLRLCVSASSRLCVELCPLL